MKYEYLIVLAVCTIPPFLLSFSSKMDFYVYPGRLLKAILFPMMLFVAWDVFAVKNGHWSFNPKYITGIHIWNLPVEEVLFFVAIPFCALFTWESVKYFLRAKK